MTTLENLPELDYAFLAEFARVEGDSLTAVGASFTRVALPSLPAPLTLHVAGRIRAREGGAPFPVKIRVGNDDGSSGLVLETTMNPKQAVNPYEGKVGLVFTAEVPLKIDSAGRYRAEIFINNALVRKLYFSVDILENVGG
ncbi:hypothetical protein AOZ07_17730 [Glutamicibacter halophytocola]|uniref:DUF6941 family protein n=1 Tax=Glutamicibacter halophytocola TaxID=1933880 RepID=UPI0006D4C144|nr:hypothetical protein [Glutamicibacter halophytocola]ALG30635.1 hypothetical protein AOZ07_17730 [Glutamicibacter halophytocola]